MNDFTNFRAIYDELTEDVTRAQHPFAPDHLRNWFHHLDSTPQVSAIVGTLEDGLDIDGWMSKAKETKKLDWGEDREKALGTKLLLFRAFASTKENIGLLAFHFLRERNVNDGTRRFVEQVFSPMSRELRRLLDQRLNETAPAPASDRTVTIDHNRKDYADAERAMQGLETAIREANDFPDPLEKEQREAEVSAARRLLRASLVRLEPLVALLKPILVQYTTKVKDGLIAAAALATVTALTVLLGQIFKAMLG
ncbi:hypothetical protein AS156_04040 [Bradyrhizobium macuxiense]|uniref:Uncharacterized protein n=1 Tax=Bradyrhizobium macuxiense TaxID=1755647 RepID=A0A109JX36_9BRAD|nr:hypothetical protein [Bradyrhizobium macuxiense]KWV56656.1 hypothetical protein AS156_04040 [Bradyrhizobium macuxiense]